MEREFKEISRVLKEAKRRGYIQDFALTGALALSALTQPRATKDIDFIVDLEKDRMPFFIEWLRTSKEYSFVKHHIGRRQDRIKDLIEVRLGSTWVDIIISTHQIEKDAAATGIPISIYKSLKIKVVRPEYLLLLKLFAGSDQDFIDGAHLWNEGIDRDFVKGKAEELHLSGKLKKLEGIARRIHAKKQ
ncbi:MAG: nucleotidyl transferase AbiEii/AbiGii toxin family protein [Deltaproteobacteria bacterium]|nr:nucleotidyl transferase AbiEii/AbiGii toxin family protein [Deltaproteobacteria bacterium]MCL4873146.1 nucleotidyl transferase AbiEii/AbiGii toxin family protein [bacterium]